jgi:hypothetical protein
VLTTFNLVGLLVVSIGIQGTFMCDRNWFNIFVKLRKNHKVTHLKLINAYNLTKKGSTEQTTLKWNNMEKHK